MATITQSMKVFFYTNDPPSLLTAGFDRIRVQQSDDGGVTWDDITDPSTDLVIDATRFNYFLAIDAADSTSFFRAVLHSSTGSPVDVPQVPLQAIDTSFEAVLTIAQLKAIYLFGVDLTEDTGAPYPDEMFAHYIRYAIDTTERELDIKILPTKFVNDRYDFYRRDYSNFGFLQLKEYPAISIERYALQYPGAQNAIIDFDKTWIQLDKNHGHVQVYPSTGIYTNAFISSGGGYLPLIYGGAEYLPNLIVVDYTAGFELGKIPPSITEVVAKRASFGPLNIAGDLIGGAGIATKSLSIDGLSNSVGTTSSPMYAGYGARLIQYEKELKTQIPMLRKFFKGVRMTAV